MSHTDVARTVLEDIYDPCSTNSGCPLSLVEMGMVKELREEDGRLDVLLELTEPHCMFAFRMEDEVVSRLREALPGVEVAVRLVFDPTDPWTEERIATDAMTRLTAHRRTRLPLLAVNTAR